MTAAQIPPCRVAAVSHKRRWQAYAERPLLNAPGVPLALAGTAIAKMLGSGRASARAVYRKWRADRDHRMPIEAGPMATTNRVCCSTEWLRIPAQ